VYTAFRLVDYVHKQYDIEMPLAVWDKLLEWAYVMAYPTTDKLLATRGWRRASQKSRRDVMLRLWHIMTSPPYRQQPDIAMMDLFIKNIRRAQSPKPMLELMHQGKQLYLQSLRAFEQAERKLALIEALHRHGIQFGSDGLSVQLVRRELERARLRERQHRRLGHVWLRAYVGLSFDFEKMPQFERIDIPRAVADWIAFNHRKYIRYFISSGTVELRIPSEAESVKLPTYDIVTGRENTYDDATGRSLAL
jgi:hypothetical protein